MLKEILGPPLRAGALTAAIFVLIFLAVKPPSLSGLEDVIVGVAGAAVVLLVTAWLVVLATGKEMPEAEFRKLEARSEELASKQIGRGEITPFDELVIEALDDLPEEFRKLLETTPVLVSDLGHQHRAYGHYIGDTIARNNYRNHIVIYRDTLERDFGHDPVLLKAQVERTVRHELAHHLGWDERGVADLGL